MALEIEVKVLEIDADDVVRRLEALGAEQTGSFRLVTAVFDFPDRRLLDAGAYARVRRKGTEVVEVAYKGGGSVDSGYKVKREIEFEAGDFDAACEFLIALGLERVNHLEKDRTVFSWGDVEFSIDRFPILPPFLEIEASSEAGVDRGLAALEIPRERANTMGPRELFRHYGLDLEAMRVVAFS